MSSNTMLRYADYQAQNPDCKPDWRWVRVAGLCERMPTPGRCTRRDDHYIRRARNFQMRYKAAEADPAVMEALIWEHPGMHAAYQINLAAAEDGPEKAHTIQARLLARQSFEEIGFLMNTSASAVEWYAALFFDVVPRLEKRDWVNIQVPSNSLVRAAEQKRAAKKAGAGTAGQSGNAVADEERRVPAFAHGFFDTTIKAFACFGGPLVLDALLTGFDRNQTATSADQIPTFFEKSLFLTVRRRAAQAALSFEANRYNVMQLMDLALRIGEIERSVDRDDASLSSIESHSQALFGEINFVSGKRGQVHLAGTPLGVGTGRRFCPEAGTARDVRRRRFRPRGGRHQALGRGRTRSSSRGR